jgi:hypothetical protein
VLLGIGAFFLWRNTHPEVPVFDIIAQYWPFLLIGWGVLRLIEIVIRRDGAYIGFSGGEVALVVLICIAGGILWEGHQHGMRFYGGSVEMFGEQFDYPVSAQGSAAGMTRITFENPRGNIRVTGADTTEVTIAGHKTIRAWTRNDADRSNDSTPVEVVPQGDRLLIRTNQDRVPDAQRISDDLEVTVPRGVAIEARGRSGDCEISDVTGDVEWASDRADVRLVRIGGNARLEIGRSDLIRAVDLKGRLDVQGSRGSDLELENITGQVTINGSFNGALEFKNLAKPLQFEGARNTELHAEAVPGRISMNLGQVTGSNIVGPMRLITGSRDVALDQFTNSLELETQRGDIQLQPGRLPLPAIDAKCGVGRIELVIPDRSTFDLEAVAERGEAVNDYGPPIETERERRTSTLKGKAGDGPTIRLTANHGSVSVRKEGTEPSEIPPPPSGKMPKPPRPPKAPKTPDIQM